MVNMTRFEKLKSIDELEMAKWLARSQLDWTANLYKDLRGINWTYTEEDVNNVAKETYKWL